MIRRWLVVRAATRVTKAAERVRVNDLLAEMDAANPGRLDRLDWPVRDETRERAA